MTQDQIDRAVAEATGERLADVRSRGFSLLNNPAKEREPRTVDWDLVDQRYRVGFQRARLAR